MTRIGLKYIVLLSGDVDQSLQWLEALEFAQSNEFNAMLSGKKSMIDHAHLVIYGNCNPCTNILKPMINCTASLIEQSMTFSESYVWIKGEGKHCLR